MNRFNVDSPAHIELRLLHTGRTIRAVLSIATLTGILCGGAIGSLALALEWPRGWALTLAAGFLSGAGSWMLGVAWLYREWERISRPAEPQVSTRFEVHRTPNSTQIHSFRTANNSQVMQLATLLAKGNRINSSVLERIFGGRGGANAFRDELIESNYLRWVSLDSPKDGVALTEKGRGFFTDIVVSPDSPTRPSVAPSPTEAALLKDGFTRVRTQYSQRDANE